MKILVVEDEKKAAEYLRQGLSESGYTVEVAHSGTDGLHAAANGDHDLVVLDVMLPGIDGFAVLSALRTSRQIPVLMLTARDRVDDKVRGFELGADDYLVKPFELAEVEARLKALHRRATGKLAHGPLRVADLEYDPASFRAQRDGRDLVLSPTGRKLLEFLMRQTGRIVSREELEYLIWGDEPPDADVLRAHMHKLREAIDRDFGRKLLHTFRGAGYRLAALN